ncbi:Oidioi.mRNA.OKI2018_I69.PAR.g9465.t1.cds [Oikopleura dioica]|uniref:glutaminase n=1 Tax=Oikopleura dioica TaxID=34765 RepID=A0ABN7RP80_OIKDI|nr:Oidioi.mRNA.OKI2018_I69.PAR.g9465.t1.cds [Oikopleura dioica]
MENKNTLEKIFEIFKTEKGSLNLSKFVKTLNDFGILNDDPRLAPFLKRVKELQEKKQLNFEAFLSVLDPTIEPLIVKAFSGKLIIPSFKEFKKLVEEVFEDVRDCKDGKAADYIPQLARVDPDLWGLSVCTVDGQRFNLGDFEKIYTIQSTSKPFTYAMALDLYGSDYVQEYVSAEPSGEGFNEICLDDNNKPHNPMINAGAIVTSSLVKPELNLADRFEYMMNIFRKLSGGTYVGFNNSVYLSEKSVADRNFALGYYMKENDCFPKGSCLKTILEFYFQLCSIETKCSAHCIMAGTLANGGVCPITGEEVLDDVSVQHTLSLMLSCGMYDYSGQFAYKIGLPAKSGVSGSILVVIPNVMAICLYSPRLDKLGNSSRGLLFMEKLLKKVNLHQFDSDNNAAKIDPRGHISDFKDLEKNSILQAAMTGDLEMLRRHFSNGADIDVRNVIGQTILHIAVAEENMRIVKYLVDVCEMNLNAKDTWGETPLDIAEKRGNIEISTFLRCRMILKDLDSSQIAKNRQELAGLKEQRTSVGSEDSGVVTSF